MLYLCNFRFEFFQLQFLRLQLPKNGAVAVYSVQPQTKRASDGTPLRHTIGLCVRVIYEFRQPIVYTVRNIILVKTLKLLVKVILTKKF